MQRVLERLITANHLEKGVLGEKWEVIVVNSLSKFYRSTRASRANKKSLELE